MIGDILTVMWKERQLLFRHQGSRARTVMTSLVPVVMVAIYLPWQTGSDWVDSPVALFALIVPMMLVGMAIPDSFAGERERHTLETLLASRLSDRAILFGKVALAVGYGWTAMIIIMLLGLVTVNVVHWDGHVLLYTPAIALMTIVLSFLVAMVVAGAGILISLRAGTAQEAQQLLMTAMMVPPMLLGLAFLLLRDRLRDIFEGLDFTHVVLILGAVLAVVGMGLLWAAMARFRRARMILG